MTDIPQIPALPAAPQRGQDPAVFIQRADAFVDALAGYSAALNAFGAAFVAAFTDLSTVKFTAASASQVAIGIGARNFAATVGVAFSAGQTVIVASAVDPTKNMQGQITSYNAATGALVVGVTIANGNGTLADWRIGLAPAVDIEARLAKFKTDAVDPVAASVAALAASLGSMSTRAKAAMADLFAWTADKGLTADVVGAAFAQQALAYAATLAWDWREGFYRGQVVCTGNIVVGTPTNIRAGETRIIGLVGDSATARTVSFSSAFKGTVPQITDLTASKPYRLVIFADSATNLTADARALA